MHIERMLASGKSGCGERVDLLDVVITHCVTTDGNTRAMHHQETAGARVRAVVGIRIAQVESQVIGTLCIELVGGDAIKAFRCLVVAFTLLGAELTGIRAHRIGAKEDEALCIAFDPQLQFLFALEDAHEHRRAITQAELLQVTLQRRLHPSCGDCRTIRLCAGKTFHQRFPHCRPQHRNAGGDGDRQACNDPAGAAAGPHFNGSSRRIFPRPGSNRASR